MAGLFSSATLEQVRAASDIVDVIGSYLPLKRAGANFVALCPFHKEKTPSFNVNPHRQIFHCFGCHKGGDVFTFLREYENISFPEAVHRLAERARIPLEFEKDPARQKNRFLKDTLLQIHEQITQRWQAALANAGAGQARGIGFSGRVLRGDEKTAKYVNSPETPIFTKGKVFVGLDKSKRALLEAGFAVVCEGQLDLIACYMAGIHNIVAPQGTALTAEHARILKRYVDEVVLCFDSDAAGRKIGRASCRERVEDGGGGVLL